MSLQSKIEDFKCCRKHWKFRRRISNTADMLFDNAVNFFLFCVITIFTINFFYAQTLDDMTSSFVLGILWLVFWQRSQVTGKVMLVWAAVVGMIHEIIGVQLGWFTYATDLVYGVPLWVFFGYGVMFWACENLWRSAEKKHYFTPQGFKLLFITMLLGIIFLDFTVFALPSGGWIDIIYFILIALLFYRNVHEQHLAVTVGFLTGLNEALGEIFGSWYHGPYQYAKFSLIELIPSYVFGFWMALVIVYAMLGTRKITRREWIIAIIAFTLRFGVAIPEYLAYHGLI